MRSGEDAKRSIFSDGVVKVQPERQDLLKRASRGMRVVYAVFDRPRSRSGDIAALAQRQSCVLVPHDEPVGDWRFIEQGGAKRKGAFAKDLLRQFHQTRIKRHLRN